MKILNIAVFLAVTAFVVLPTTADAADQQEFLPYDELKALGEVEPLFGRRVTVCAGQSHSGWGLENVTTDFTRCGGSWDNLWQLIELNGAQPGQRATLCAGSRVPAGWSVVATHTDFTKCGRNQSFNNLKTIQKL